MYLQNSASMQPRLSPPMFGNVCQPCQKTCTKSNIRGGRVVGGQRPPLRQLPPIVEACYPSQAVSPQGPGPVRKRKCQEKADRGSGRCSVEKKKRSLKTNKKFVVREARESSGSCSLRSTAEHDWKRRETRLSKRRATTRKEALETKRMPDGIRERIPSTRSTV